MFTTTITAKTTSNRKDVCKPNASAAYPVSAGANDVSTADTPKTKPTLTPTLSTPQPSKENSLERPPGALWLSNSKGTRGISAWTGDLV